MQDKDGKLTFDMNKIQADAEVKARRYFSDEDKEYFVRLMGVDEAFKRLKNFENNHQYAPYTNDPDFFTALLGGFSVEWYAVQHGLRIGKMNSKAKEMLEEQEDE